MVVLIRDVLGLVAWASATYLMAQAVMFHPLPSVSVVAAMVLVWEFFIYPNWRWEEE